MNEFVQQLLETIMHSGSNVNIIIVCPDEMSERKESDTIPEEGSSDYDIFHGGLSAGGGGSPLDAIMQGTNTP